MQMHNITIISCNTYKFCLKHNMTCLAEATLLLLGGCTQIATKHTRGCLCRRGHLATFYNIIPCKYLQVHGRTVSLTAFVNVTHVTMYISDWATVGACDFN